MRFTIKNLVKRLARDERGATLVEYGVAVVLAVVVGTGALITMADQVDNNMTAFVPYRVADDYVAAGKLHFVKDAPEFPYPSYAVWTQNKPKALIDAALDQLKTAAESAPWISLNK